MLPAVLFDLDDTLVGRTDAFRRWWDAEAARLDVPTSAIDAVVDVEAGRYRLTRDLFVALAEGLGLPVDVDRWYAGFRAEYPSHVRLRPGAADGLRALRAAGHPIGVVTNGITVEQTAKIRLTGLDSLVDGWAISEAEGRAKPDTRIFATCLARVGADPRRGGWMVGDDIAADIGGGEAAGLATIWIPHGRARRDDDPFPGHVVDDVADAIALILD